MNNLQQEIPNKLVRPAMHTRGTGNIVIRKSYLISEVEHWLAAHAPNAVPFLSTVRPFITFKTEEQMALFKLTWL